MCVKNTEEGCILAASQDELKKDVAALDTRLTKVEAEVGQMRTEAQDAFKALNASINNLAHDFGDRMNTLDRRIVADKEKWGETLRWVVKKTVIVVLAGAAVAMGVSSINSFLNSKAKAAQQETR